jgi:ubiquitin-conjugating enzyme E2 O
LLHSACDRVEDVLQRSEKDEKAEPDGATVMSKGACIPLRRVLNRLRTLKD